MIVRGKVLLSQVYTELAPCLPQFIIRKAGPFSCFQRRFILQVGYAKKLYAISAIV